MTRIARFHMEVGLTGPDWEPTAKTKFYAQGLDPDTMKHTDFIGFGDTEERAIGQCFDAIMRGKPND